jgi:hypothetical protein
MRSLPMTLLTALGVLACLISLAGPAAGQLNQGTTGIAYLELFPGASFDPAIPDLRAFNGTTPGERPLRDDEILAYFTQLAATSPRASLHRYGASHEGRPLFYLAISDPATIADLDRIQRDHQRRLDPRLDGVPGRESLTGTKAVAWLAYGIHGDELSSPDAAAALAYWLIAGEDAAATHLRDRLVILIDPLLNPDGRARYLAQIISFAHRRANPDADDLSHTGAWPWGRGNHYLFDLNRDWFSLVQPESDRSRAIASWLPQLMVDSHEMGSEATYLFSPPRHPFNPHLPPSSRAWEQPFSDDQARALDARGYPYYSGEWNEEFFPGYGSSWVSYMGGIGILYEMSRTTGTWVQRRDRSVRTFGQAIEHQVVSSVANLATLADNAAAVLHDMIAARDQIVREGRSGKVRAWIFPRDPRRSGRVDRLGDLLTRQGIEVHTLQESGREVSGLYDITSGESVKLAIPAGSLLVRLDQPQARLARVILDPHVPMNTAFFQEEREHLEKGKGSRLYDTTAWSVSLSLGLAAYWLERPPAGRWERWTPPLPVPVAPLPDHFKNVVLCGENDTAPTVLARLLQDGLVVRVARKPFTVDGRDFLPGAMILRRDGNPDDLTERLRRIQSDLDVPMWPVATSRPQTGPDLGGDEFRLLTAPRIGVLTGSPVSTTGFGYIWHLLDQDLDLRFNNLDIGRFARIDLARYNVLVFPPIWGGTGMYRQALGEDGLARLREWIAAGGTAIGIGGGARLLADAALALTQTRLRADALDRFPPPVWSIAAEEAELAGQPAAVGLRVTAPADTDKKTPTVARHGSLYDVAPLLGPGARPFAAGHPQGKPLTSEPLPLGRWLQPVLSVGQASPSSADVAAADERLRRFMPQGALLAVDLDPESWLNHGLAGQATVWFGSNDTFVAQPPVTTAARFADVDALHRGGLLWPEAAARLTRTAYVTREAVGRGQVILFADHPAQRRWLADAERMLANALLLGPGLGTRWSAAW